MNCVLSLIVILSTFCTSSSLHTTTLLISLENGPSGEKALKEWNSYLDGVIDRPLAWVISHDQDTVNLSRTLPHVDHFWIDPEESWEYALTDLVIQSRGSTTFVLLGEGSLPHPNVVDKFQGVKSAIGFSHDPMTILTRSRSTTGKWLSDAFVSQMWVNADVLSSDILKKSGLESYNITKKTLLDIFPHIVATCEREGIVVDGTSVISSIFSVGDYIPEGGEFSIQSMEHGLFEIDAQTFEVREAVWPPLYVLETVANEDGLVIVNSVNCGYLDFASNFLNSVRKFSDINILWVTMDEVAFDFMDNLTPGCVAMFPGTKGQHATVAGAFGNDMFKTQVLVRPKILQRILDFGYTALWTDSDIVWLKNPLLLLPDVRDPFSADVMLQNDGDENNKCTCFMYLRPTDDAKELLVLWEESIIKKNASKNQGPFQDAFKQKVKDGLNYEIIPEEFFPAGKGFFDEKYVDNYIETYHSQAVIAHNNWIKGHVNKLNRFQEYYLWNVDESDKFPVCSGE